MFVSTDYVTQDTWKNRFHVMLHSLALSLIPKENVKACFLLEE